jgi:PAS domain S-box-containing protein
VYELGNGQWDIPGLRTLLEGILPESGSFRDFEVTHHFEGIGAEDAPERRKVRQPGNHSELILLAIEDVTPTWRAGVDFADNRERYRVIVEGAVGFAIFTFDTEGVITSWNAGAAEMLGYTEEEILGENFRIIFTPEDLRDQQGGLGDADGGGGGPGPRRAVAPEEGGEPFYAQGLVMPLKDDADEIRGFLKIIRDKTEERQLQDALGKRTAELEEPTSTRTSSWRCSPTS